jgi:hypothetical protein
MATNKPMEYKGWSWDLIEYPNKRGGRKRINLCGFDTLNTI